MVAHFSAPIGGYYYKLLSQEIGLLQKILILVSILKVFPNSHCKMRNLFLHMPNIFGKD
jgi:hypothetical protein